MRKKEEEGRDRLREEENGEERYKTKASALITTVIALTETRERDR